MANRFPADRWSTEKPNDGSQFHPQFMGVKAGQRASGAGAFCPDLGSWSPETLSASGTRGPAELQAAISSRDACAAR
ncbi:MAG: hypothetical protein ACLFWL_15765 [Candidatus Brocadiia bacterium]